ncbi:MAG: methionyl-tRNA formyltransferase [Actinomycetota bacterium]|nr:methionyl-tRNA formyltransferase [Actinomycetota bacterium]
MRTVFLGTSEFAASVLRALALSDHRPTLVVSRPDRPQGRGRRLAAPPVAAASHELGLELYQPESVNDEAARARITAAEPEAVCVCAFGALIKDPLLSEHAMLNVHPSLLPRWRGAAPVERAIMAGDAETGVSIMHVTAGLDSGPVCAQARVPIESRDTYGTLAQRLQGLGGRLLVDVLDRRPSCREQSESGVTYAEKLSPADRLLDPAHDADALERMVRGLTPHIGAAVLLGDGERLGVWEARVLDRPPAQTPSGELDLSGAAPILACARGALELVSVQPAGKRAMLGSDYLRGRRR